MGGVISAGAPDLILRLPREDEEEVPSFLHQYEEGMPFRRYLEILGAYRRGERLPPGHVPATFLFAFVGPSIVGRASIRHALNEVLERVGGHIGYVVVPEFRRRGYATTILRVALQIAREELGIGRVLVTCDDDNLGSIKTIEKNGGVLENIVMIDASNTPKRRYWIGPVPPTPP